MLYLIFGAIYFLLQSFLIITTRVNIFPEIFFFPWSVSKGLLPYRDFFDHHGFLLYYVLAPLAQDKTLSLFKLFYFTVQTLNLIFVLVILKKVSNKIGFILGGILFVLVNYFVTDGNLWYELVIASFYLLVFLILQGKLTYRNQVLGILVALVSFIKPTAAIILFPVLYLTKSLKVLVYFFLSWIAILVFFWSKNGLRQLIDNLFLFNSYLSKNYRDTFFSDEKFLLITSVIIIILVTFHTLHKKTKIIIPTMLFLVSGEVFVFYAYTRYHLVPMAAFFVILVGQTIKHMRGVTKIIFLGILVIYLIFLGRKVKSQYFYLKTQTPWIENQASNAVMQELKNKNLANKKIYVFGNNAEIYYFLDQLPPTKYPLLFPFMNKYIPGLQDQIINDLKQRKAQAIIIPKPIDKQYDQLTKILQHIHKNYSILREEKDFKMYMR